MKKRSYILSFIVAALVLVLSSCTEPPATEKYYARFAPEPDKILSMSVMSKYASVKETYFTVYDYMDAGKNLLKFDNVDKELRIEELERNISLYTLYLEMNDKAIEIADLEIAYNNKRYSELKKQYGKKPAQSEKLELELLLQQNEMTEKSKQEAFVNRAANQQIYNTDAETLRELKNLPDYFSVPASGYLLTLTLQQNAETGGFDIGTMIPAGNVILEVDYKNKESLAEGRKVSIKIYDQWLNMYVYKINDKLLLKFADIKLTEDTTIVNFLQPQYIELSLQ